MLALLAASTLGFGFSVPSGGKECFQERASASEHVQGSWSVKSDAEVNKGWHVVGKQNR